MRIAVAIVGFNRPYYFLPTLRSIFRNEAIADCDLWCFLDGGYGNAQDLHVEILREEQSRAAFRPRRIETVLRSVNLDCGRNLIDARRRLFDQEAYDLVFLFEDDMVVGPHYIGLCRRLLEWARSRYDDVGVVQAYNACLMPPNQKAARLDEVIAANSHWWGYLMPSETWRAISETMYQYEHDFLCGHTYRRRNIPAIRRWLDSKIQQTDGCSDPHREIPLGRFPGQWDFRQYARADRSCGQDAVTAIAVGMARLTKVVTTVNRSLPIGRRGIHFTEASFKRRKLDKIRLDVFESDQFRSSFRPSSDRARSLVPYMRADEIESMRALIRDRGPRSVLEFGAGGSTTTFSREPTVQNWWSFEAEGQWIARVLSAVSREETDREKIVLIRCSEPDIRHRLDQLLQQRPFDMYFVDGFDRPAILERLHRHLKDNPGFVVLHDHGRPSYANAIDRFPVRRELTKPCGDAQGLMLLARDPNPKKAK